jgi:hypothetical protein
MPLDLYSKGTTDTLLAGKLDLSGGTMTGALNLSVSGIIFSDATYLTTAPAGSTLAADQLTAGVVTANPTAGPTAVGDVLQYDGTNLIWAAGGGGGGLTISTLSNGATSTLDATAPTAGYVLSYNGTDLIWAPDASGLTISSLSNGATSTLNATAPTTGQALTYDGTDLVWAAPVVPGKSVYSLTSNAYTLVAGDANNIVYVPAGASGGFPPINISVPDDATYTFPIGTVITVVVDNTTSASDVNLVPLGFGAPTLLGTVQIPSGSTTGIMELIKVAGNTWICGKLS